MPRQAMPCRAWPRQAMPSHARPRPASLYSLHSKPSEPWSFLAKADESPRILYDRRHGALVKYLFIYQDGNEQ